MRHALFYTRILGWVMPIAAFCFVMPHAQEVRAQAAAVDAINRPSSRPSPVPPIVTPSPIDRAPRGTGIPDASRVATGFSANRAMDARECICLVAAQSTLASALEVRRDDVQEQASDHLLAHHDRGGRSRELLAMVLTLEASEIRNREIGAALEIFFHLAQAEAQEAILFQSKAEMGRVLQSLVAQLQRGLPVRETYDTLKHQEIDLRARQLELSRTIDRLNWALKQVTSGDAPSDAVLIKPQLNWTIDPAIPDVEGAIAMGLATRPQILLLQAVVAACDAETLPMVDRILGTAHPLLAIESLSPSAILLKRILGARQRQDPATVCRGRDRARRILAWRERDVAEEIRDAALGIAASFQKVGIARERYEALTAELDRAVAKARHGLIPSPEVASARLALLKAQGQVVDETIEWHIQGVKLAQSQGILIRSCDASVSGILPGAMDAPR